jgi:hypothetical protein
MDAIRIFVGKHRTLLIVGLTVFALSMLAKILLVRVTKRALEPFQNDATAPELTLETLPPEIASPGTEPTLQQTDCDVLKKTIDALRLSEQSKKSAEFAKTELFKNIKSEMEDKYRTLECDSYLKRVASGEVSPAQTPPDMRPGPLPPVHM